MDRKEFLGTTILFGASAVAAGYTVPDHRRKEPYVNSAFSNIPNFCSHEHWGSIASIGQMSAGFTADYKAGAQPGRRVTLVDLLIDPYMSGNLSGIGINPGKIPDGTAETDIHQLAAKAPEEAFRLLKPLLEEFRLRGTYQCVRRGIKFAYGYDLDEYDMQNMLSANSGIGDNYQQIFTWYKSLMDKANFSELIRPVHPEFYFSDMETLPALDELSFTSTVMRIDPLLDFWRESHPGREQLAENLGTDPVDANSWRSFLEKMVNRASQKGCIGIKQLQAYRRTLDFEKADDKLISFRGELTETEKKRFQDWVVHECCRLANERKWPHQVHVGTHNLPESNPLPLEKLARRYPDQKIVMIHCWPYIEEAGYLASRRQNIFIDTCWQQVLNPRFLMQSMQAWLGYLPLSKITMSNDCTSIEMAVGSVMISRETLSEALAGQAQFVNLNEKDVHRIAAGFLHNNAVKIYGIGKEYAS